MSRYRPDRLEFELDEGLLKEAIEVAEKVHLDLNVSEWSNIESKAGQLSAKHKTLKSIKAKEQNALLKWAKEKGVLMPAKSFSTEWKSQGKIGGMENETYFDPTTQTWKKRNNTSYHLTYLEFLQRMAMHNRLFPESRLTLDGFTVDYDRGAFSDAKTIVLKPVFSQPHLIADRGANQAEVEAHMKHLGYHRVGSKDDYFNAFTGIRIEDLHDENVFFRDGEVLVIDPVIYLDEVGKSRRLQGAVSSISDSLKSA